MRTFRKHATWVACALLCAGWLGCGDQSTTEPTLDAEVLESAPLEPGLYLGPMEGLSTGWYRVPEAQIPVPRGSIVELKFVPESPRSEVRWEGALEVRRDKLASYAVCPADDLGEMSVEAGVPDESGSMAAHRCRFEVIDFDPNALQVGDVRLATRRAALTDAASNEETMEAFFGGSIASVTQVGPDHYRTSTGTRLNLLADVSHPKRDWLNEWRVDGVGVARGRGFQRALDDPGEYEISVGPPARARTIRVDVYSVRITSHRSNLDVVANGTPVTFTAETEPAGFEDEIRWLSSTKYGSARPVTGRGGSFTVTFADTWGSNQWLGVKADNVVFNQDQKPPTIDSISPLSGGEGTIVTVTGSGFGTRPEDLCFTILSGNKTLPFEVLTTTDTQVTAMLGPLAATDTGGVIMIQKGLGEYDATPPAPFGLTPLDDVWSWEGSGDDPHAESQQVFTPLPGANKQTTMTFGQLVDGKICLDWIGACPVGTTIRVWARIWDDGSPRRHHDNIWKSYQLNLNASEDFMANLICGLMLSKFQELGWDHLGCFTSPGDPNGVKITIESDSSNIVWGDFTITKTLP